MAGKPSHARPGRLAAAHAISIGFVPLIDATPLIAAFELGYFRREGLDRYGRMLEHQIRRLAEG